MKIFTTVILAFLFWTFEAVALDHDYGLFVADTEPVYVRCLRGNATGESRLYFENTGELLCDVDDIGLYGSIGSFPPGTELIFRIDTIDIYGVPYSFYTGPSSRNPDGVGHVRINSGGIGYYTVYFEDQYDLGDGDLDDVAFQLTGPRLYPLGASDAEQFQCGVEDGRQHCIESPVICGLRSTDDEFSCDDLITSYDTSSDLAILPVVNVSGSTSTATVSPVILKRRWVCPPAVIFDLVQAGQTTFHEHNGRPFIEGDHQYNRGVNAGIEGCIAFPHRCGLYPIDQACTQYDSHWEDSSGILTIPEVRLIQGEVEITGGPVMIRYEETPQDGCPGLRLVN